MHAQIPVKVAMVPARNEFYTWGSVKKYGHRCGDAMQEPDEQEASRPQAATTNVVRVAIPATSRSCGACTTCCNGWLEATVLGHQLKPDGCRFCGKDGCTIYDQRPEDPCRTYVCGWLGPGSPFPDSFRPDKLGVIINTTEWRGRRAYRLVPAGRDPDEALLTAMREISNTTGACIYYVPDQGGRKVFFGPPEFEREMLAGAPDSEPDSEMK